MQQYIGVKIINAEPLNLGDYNIRRGWTIPENEDPKREGYFLVQENGHQTWSPKEDFDNAYRQTNGQLTFGLAIEAMKKGYKVARCGWDDKGMFIYIRPGQSVKTRDIPNLKTLPDNIKKWIDENIDDKKNPGEEGLNEVKFTSYICMKDADNTIVNGWSASQTDMLAEDWMIHEG